MADAARRLVGPAVLTTTAATKYTVPPSTTTVMRHVRVCNTTAIAAAFTLSIGADAAGTRLWAATSVPANGTLDWTGFEVLGATEIIQAFAGTATALTLTISGIETS